MPVKEDLKVEAYLDHALRRHEFRFLEGFLQKESSSQKCSKELLLKLDQLVSRELDKKDIKNVSLLLNVIYKCSKCVTSSGEWLTTAIHQGLVEKLSSWYERIRNILICAGSARNKTLLTLTEDFFDVVMAVHDHNSDGKIQILENFISKACSLVADTPVSTCIKQEAVRKLNLMLDAIPREARKRLIFTKEMLAAMSAMGRQILEAGDYDLQVAITEALCRMTPETVRQELAGQWFPMEFITTAFKKIKDSEFETDCRIFLNLVNGMLGDKRRVFTYPCISAHLDNHKLQTPSDEKLEEFWVDFNIGTQSISFYVSTEDNNESHQWETVCITESEVDLYNVEEINSRTLLTVNLNTPSAVGHIKGNQIRIYFDSTLGIADAVRKVFGLSKCKGFVKKKTISVAKTSVHIVFDECGSQILIPESQGSLNSLKEVTVFDTRDAGVEKQPPLSTPCLNQQVCKDDTSRNPAKSVTPNQSKVSEASINISVAAGELRTGNSSASTKTSAFGIGRIKPPLEMVNSAKISMTSTATIKDYTRHTKQIASTKKNTAPDKGTVQSKDNHGKLPKGDEQIEMVPGTQFPAGNTSVLMPGFNEKYLESNRRHPMSTRQKEKLKKACDVVDKPQTFSTEPEIKKPVHNISAKHINNKKTKAQTSDECKSTKWENHTGNDVKERNIQQRTCNYSFSMVETSFSKSIQKSDTHLRPENPETERRKSEITNVEKSKSFRCVTRRKDTEKSTNEKTIIKDAVKTLVNNIGNKYSKATMKRKQEEASFRENVKKNNQQTNKVKNESKKVKAKGSKGLNVDDAEQTWDDVYSFCSKGSDEPTIDLGISSIFASKPMVNIAVTNSGTSLKKNNKGKNGSEQKLKNPHKHLFSDTDTDRGGDDSKTDLSWLQDLGSKKKPNIVGYSRQKQGKQPKEKSGISEAADISTPSWKKRGKQQKVKPELRNNNLDNKDDEKTSKPSKLKRLQRANGKRKNSPESSNSESEEIEPPIRKHTPKIQRELPTTKKQQKNPEHPSATKTPKNLPVTEVGTVCSDKLLSCVYKKPPSPVCSSPGSVEQNRSERYESDPEIPSRHPTMAHSSPSLSASPLDQTLEESVNISKEVEKANRQRTEPCDKSAPKWAPTTCKRGTNLNVGKTVQPPLSPAQSQLSQDDICPSIRSGSSERRTSSCERTFLKTHESGPASIDTISYIKRINKERSHHADIGTEGSDHEVKRKKIKLRPCQLFPSPDVRAPQEHQSSVSRNDSSAEAVDTWERSSSDVGIMCKQISKEFARKIQNRSRKMDYFTKQSLKSTQKHVTSVDVQVRECRIMHLEKFHQTILEEIESFEKDSQALQQMEKEFAQFCSQQTKVLHLYHKNERRRIQNLKASFDENVSQSKDIEQTIFTSGMLTMKEHMKAVQGRLLKEMQEEELLSVRRGLQSLFMSDAGPF